MKRLIFFLSLLILSVLLLSSCEHTHSFGEWETVTNSTCSEAGVKKRVCECGETETEAIEKKNHEIIYVSETKPTCTTVGQTSSAYCKVCGEFTKNPETIPASHSYKEHIEAYPSCTRYGINVYTCTVCHSAHAEQIEPLGHSWTAATCTAPSLCKICLNENGSALGHTTAYGKCDRCDNFVTPTVATPTLPLELSNQILFCKTAMRIDAISYTFAPNSVTFSFAGQKIEDAGTLEDGKYFCGFTYKLYDKNNALVTTGQYTITGLSVGDLFADKTLTIEFTSKMTSHYTLVIEDYAP